MQEGAVCRKDGSGSGLDPSSVLDASVLMYTLDPTLAI